MMRVTFLPAIAISVAVLFVSVGFGQPTDVPDIARLSGFPDQRPLWLSAAAVDRQEVVREHSPIEALDALLASDDYQTTGCLSAVAGRTMNSKLHISDLEELAQQSKGILLGTVLSATPGFYQGMEAGTLFRLSLEKAIKSSNSIATRDDFLLFLPVGRFEAGGYRFCPQAPAFSTTPTIGSRLVVFSTRPALDEERRIVAPIYNTVFFETNGRLLSPPSWRPFLDSQGISKTTGLELLVSRLDELLESER